MLDEGGRLLGGWGIVLDGDVIVLVGRERVSFQYSSKVNL